MYLKTSNTWFTLVPKFHFEKFSLVSVTATCWVGIRWQAWITCFACVTVMLGELRGAVLEQKWGRGGSKPQELCPEIGRSRINSPTRPACQHRQTYAPTFATGWDRRKVVMSVMGGKARQEWHVILFNVYNIYEVSIIIDPTVQMRNLEENLNNLAKIMLTVLKLNWGLKWIFFRTVWHHISKGYLKTYKKNPRYWDT